MLGAPLGCAPDAPGAPCIVGASQHFHRQEQNPGPQALEHQRGHVAVGLCRGFVPAGEEGPTGGLASEVPGRKGEKQTEQQPLASPGPRDSGLAAARFMDTLAGLLARSLL